LIETAAARIAAIVATVVAGASATPSPERFEYRAVHMGMPVRLVVWAGDRPLADTAAHAAFARIAALDAMMSDYRVESEINRVATHAGTWVPVSRELFDVVSRALDIARATEGAFDPTIGPLTRLWRDARATERPPTAQAIADARRRVGWRHVALDAARPAVRLNQPGMSLDLGGIAKGYILQSARDVLVAHGCPQALLEAGGDIVVGAAPPGAPGWRIDVLDGGDAFRRRARALTHAALATSGPTSQFLEHDGVRYSHVIDPASGAGVTTARVVHVIAADAATADALATAIGVLDPARLPSALAGFPNVMWTVR
jgi:thiamine biosynthesis lipoprotein